MRLLLALHASHVQVRLQVTLKTEREVCVDMLDPASHI